MIFLQARETASFVDKVFSEYGLAVAILVLVIIGLGFAVWQLWKKNHEMGKSLKDTAKTIADIRKGEEEKRATMREAHVVEMHEVKRLYREAIEKYSERLDELQEKRVQEANSVVREVLEHINAVDNSVKQITEAVRVLRDVVNKTGN